MAEADAKPKGCKRRRWLCAAFFLPAVVVGLAAVLCFGNPQWSRHIYMWQLAVWPGPPAGRRKLQPPASYTGEWVDYGSDGVLHSKAEYLNGRRHGRTIVFYDDGTVYRLIEYKHDEPHGRYELYLTTGQRWRQSFNRNGIPHGVTSEWADSGALTSRKYFLEDQGEVTEAEYRAAAEKDPTLPKPWEDDEPGPPQRSRMPPPAPE